jgi:hypothetical protein
MANPRISLTPEGEVVLLWPAEAHLVDEMEQRLERARR